MSETAASEGNETNERSLAPVLGVFALFLATVLGALYLAPSFAAAGLQTFENTGDVSNSLIIIVEILVVTGVFLLAARYGVGRTVLRALLVGVFAFSVWLALGVAFPELGGAGGWIATGLAVGAGVALWVYPEWYVIDAVAVLAGAAITAQLGISMSPLPVFVLLVAMAVYDAYSVYVSGHMVDLAEGVGDLKLPMVFVVPESPSFSLREADNVVTGDADAAMLGLGDAFFPGLLAVSGGTFLDAAPLFPGTALNLPAVGAVAGGVVGMIALQYLAARVEGAHAGLPALNGGVLAGYLLGAYAAGVPFAAALGLA